jgi:hypothetical protein
MTASAITEPNANGVNILLAFASRRASGRQGMKQAPEMPGGP